MPPPDPPLHPNGLSIPMTQTLSSPRTPQLTTPSPVKPSPLMTPTLSTSLIPIPPLTLTIGPTSIM